MPALYQAMASSASAWPPKPGTSGPLNGMPDSARLSVPGMHRRRWCQLLQLSPVHSAVQRLEPVAALRESTNGRSSGRAALEAFPGRLRHAGGIEVVVRPVIPLAVLEAHVVDLGGAGARVVHVDPRAAEAPVAELARVAGPPGAALGQRVVGKPGAARPHEADVGLAFRVLAEDAGLQPALGDLVAVGDLDARVEDGHDAAALVGERAQFGRAVAELRRAGGEDLEVLHVVDVQPQAVVGELVFGERRVQRVQVARAGIAPAALVVAQRPQRRQRRDAHQALQAPRDRGHAVARDHVERRHALVGAEPEAGRRAEVVLAAEEPVRAGVHEHVARMVDQHADPAARRCGSAGREWRRTAGRPGRR